MAKKILATSHAPRGSGRLWRPRAERPPATTRSLWHNRRRLRVALVELCRTRQFLPRRKFYQEAKADFERALSGRASDTWRARTYGLHFVESSRTASWVSSSSTWATWRPRRPRSGPPSPPWTPNARTTTSTWSGARRLPGAPSRTWPEPEVNTNLEPGAFSHRGNSPLRSTRDDVGVAELKVNDQPVYQRGASQAAWLLAAAKEIVLDEGTHKIEVAAKDPADKEVKRRWRLP